jgi:hypothetical protein
MPKPQEAALGKRSFKAIINDALRKALGMGPTQRARDRRTPKGGRRNIWSAGLGTALDSDAGDGEKMDSPESGATGEQGPRTTRSSHDMHPTPRRDLTPMERSIGPRGEPGSPLGLLVCSHEPTWPRAASESQRDSAPQPGVDRVQRSTPGHHAHHPSQPCKGCARAANRLPVPRHDPPQGPQPHSGLAEWGVTEPPEVGRGDADQPRAPIRNAVGVERRATSRQVLVQEACLGPSSDLFTGRRAKRSNGHGLMP